MAYTYIYIYIYITETLESLNSGKASIRLHKGTSVISSMYCEGLGGFVLFD